MGIHQVFDVNFILGIFTKPLHEITFYEYLLRDYFIKDLAETKTLIPNTESCIGNFKNNIIYGQLYKTYAKILHYLLLISNQIDSN